MTRRKIRKELPPAMAISEMGGFEQAIFAIFRPIGLSRRNSETVQDTTKVTIEH